jgi:hypothetical protein
MIDSIWVGILVGRVRRVLRFAASEGTLNVEYKRSGDGADWTVNVSGNPANTTRAYRDTDFGARHERNAELRRDGPDHDGERTRLPDFPGHPYQPGTASCAHSSQDGRRTALQGGLHQRPSARPRRCGTGIHGAIAAVLEDCIPSGGLGIVERTQEDDGTDGRKITYARTCRDACSECSGNACFAPEEVRLRIHSHQWGIFYRFDFQFVPQRLKLRAFWVGFRHG